MMQLVSVLEDYGGILYQDSLAGSVSSAQGLCDRAEGLSRGDDERFVVFSEILELRHLERRIDLSDYVEMKSTTV